MRAFDFKDLEEDSPSKTNGSSNHSRGNKNSNSTNNVVLCRDWKANGTCRFVDECRFAHGYADPRIPYLPSCRVANENSGGGGRNSRQGSASRNQGGGGISDQFNNLSIHQQQHPPQQQRQGESVTADGRQRKVLFLNKNRGESSSATASSSQWRSQDRPSPPRHRENGGFASQSRDWKQDKIDNRSMATRTPEKGGNNNNNNNNYKNKSNSVDRRGGAKRNAYTPHLSRDELLTGISDKVLLEGILRINKKNRQDGYVRFEGSDDVFIPGIRNQNRALDGDVVVVRILEGEELEREKRVESEKKSVRAKQNQERQAKVNFFEQEDEEVEFEETRTYGIIVGILESNTRSQNHVGVLSLVKPNMRDEEDTATEVGRFVWFWPNDKRVPYILIPSQLVPSEVLNARDTFSTTLYTAKITGWNDSSVYPLGTFTGKLGQMGELPTESEALLVAAGITWEDFSDEVLASLVETPWSIPESEVQKRVDLRKERIFSIDPPTARDLDDAVSVKDLGDGTFELGVHIADVSYFVTPGTALDKEAYHRATSVYLVQKVIPMLPRLLCEELCSLNAGVDRLAFSVFWNIDENANIIGEPRFARSIINSCAKLWYDHAQAVIEDRDWNQVNPVTLAGGWTPEQVHQDIKTLFSLSQKLRTKRYESGALTLNSIKLWFKLDDVGNPIQSGVYEQKEANRLIEEFMLLANMAVAKKISASYPEAALLRRHPPPLQKALEEVTEMLKKEGIVLDIESAGSLHSSLEAVEDPIKRMLARLLLIKGMKRAEYFCTGSVDISTFSHYALNVPLYTHFTSPIRRYCDLVVHRLLDATINDQEMPFSKHLIDGTSNQCNVRKFASKDAQDASQHLFLCAFLYDLQQKELASSHDSEQKVGIIAEALVNNVGSRSFDVVVPTFGIETRVWLEDSMDQGKIAGIESDVDNLKLKIHWKRLVELEEEVDLDGRDGEPATAGLDLKRHFTQVVGMFDSVQVQVVVDMKKSPPGYKLFAVQPNFAA